jgi:tetratricopeptide (TPR) repeat protein
MEVLDRFEALPLDSRPSYWHQLEIMNNHERYDEKLAKLIEIMQRHPEVAGTDIGVVLHTWWMASQIAGLGLLEEAKTYYDAVAPLPSLDSRRDMFLEGWYLIATGRGAEYNEALVADIAGMSTEEILDQWHVGVLNYAISFWETGEREQAIELVEALQHKQQAPLWAERQTQIPFLLAAMYLEVGRTADAQPLLEATALVIEEQFDAGMRHPQALYRLALVYALLGNDASAGDMLELAVDYGSFEMVSGPAAVTAWSDDILDPFPDTPRFNHTRNRMHNLMEQQAANVRDLLANNDLEAILVPVFEYAAAAAEIKKENQNKD